MDWLREAAVGYLVLLNESPVEAVDRSSTVDEGFGDDVFVESVFEDRQSDTE